MCLEVNKKGLDMINIKAEYINSSKFKKMSRHQSWKICTENFSTVLLNLTEQDIS